MRSPFSLDDPHSYRAWRATKLHNYPRDGEALSVEVADPRAPSARELAAIRTLVAKTNMAIVRGLDPKQITSANLIGLGQRLGLRRLDANPCADEQAVSSLQVANSGDAADYIPYTSRALSWHTDGYYNRPDRQVRAWMLFCVRQAEQGGGNALLDHEIAYIRLRDRAPELVRALMQPRAFTVPPNRKDELVRRPQSTGPVFSIIGDALHMRYSARTRHIHWLEEPAVADARGLLDELFSSGDDYMFSHKLAPGEGYVTNNVLHNRTAFQADDGAARLLLRARYYDRVF